MTHICTKVTINVLFSAGALEGPGGVSILCAGQRLVFMLSSENLPALRATLPPAHGRGRLPGSYPNTHPNSPDAQSHRLQAPPHPTPNQRFKQLAQGGDATSASSTPTPSPPASNSATPFTRSGQRATCSAAAKNTQAALVSPGFPPYKQN